MTAWMIAAKPQDTNGPGVIGDDRRGLPRHRHMPTLIERDDVQPELRDPLHNLLCIPERREGVTAWALRMLLSCPAPSERNSGERLDAEEEEVRSQCARSALGL
eukprot:2299473-Pyramimonas_sp.AAC.1